MIELLDTIIPDRSFRMATIPQVAAALQDVLTTTAEQAGRATGFVCGEPS
jgi:hypothetical protein